MSQFIQPEDYDASIHSEILGRLTRDDAAVVEICEDRAAEGSARNQLVLMMTIDIAVYHLFSIHNPQKMSPIRKDRYERAIEWLKQVAAFKITVDGAPGLPDEERKQDSPWMFSSNPKRTTHI